MSRSMDHLAEGTAANPGTIVFTGDGPLALVNADFDGDGKLDLAILDALGAPITIIRGDGRGGFHSPTSDAVELAQRKGSIPERLTARETEVANLLMRGYTDREIATVLGVGRRTAETHAANVRAKLRVKSRRELLRGVWPVARAS